jgi:hypothetical protein
MHRRHAPLLARLRSAAGSGAKLILLSAMAAAAGAAESVHGWGLVDWGMTEAQVQSAYGDNVEKPPVTRNRRTEIVETLHLKNPLMINGIAMKPSFVFSRASKGLEKVVMRASLTNAGSEQCQAAYGKIRQSVIGQLAEPIEEKPALRSLHAMWHGTAADARLSLTDVTGRCFLTLVYNRPNLATAPSDETTDSPAERPGS